LTTRKQKGAPTNKDLDSSQDAESAQTREPTQVFLKGETRKRQRRVDLRTLHSTARESARIYRAMVNGEISQEFADTASRVLGRHRDILAAHDQSEYHRSIEERLMAIEHQRKPLGAPVAQLTSAKDKSE
jgi:hypothetical protein